MGTLQEGFELERLKVTPLTGEVTGPGGRERLDPKVMDVLVHMAGHAGHVELREDLLARLWPNAVVTDDALTRCFYELRRCLSHVGGDERYKALLETVPKRGYRLNATVKPLDAPSTMPEPPSPRGGGLILAVSASTVLLIAIAAGYYAWRSPGLSGTSAEPPVAHGIAVLPFLDMSEAKDQGYLSDGVTEEILNRLSQSQNLRVISRTSSFALRDEVLDVPQIAARLDVSYVLEGSLRRAGKRVRITAQLIDASTNSHIWSRTYDRAIDDLFAIQDEIAASVAAALQTTLAGKTPPPQPPASVDAYAEFLQGQFFYHRRSPGDIERATDHYRQAVKLDPEFARAWAALAGTYSLAIGETYANSNDALRDLQGAAARKAVELDPRLAIAHARLAQYYFQVQEREKGREHMRIAADLDPEDPLVLGFSASDAVWRGDIGAAVEIWRRIVAQDPLSPTSRGNFAYMLYANGRLEESLAENRRALEINPDAGPGRELDVARILILLGRYDEAELAIARLPAGNWRDSALALLTRAPGRRQEADAALRRLAAAPKDVLAQVQLAEAYAWRGRTEEALGSLLDFQRSLERDSSQPLRNQWYFQDEIRMSPLLKPLHADPRWAELTTTPG